MLQTNFFSRTKKNLSVNIAALNGDISLQIHDSKTNEGSVNIADLNGDISLQIHDSKTNECI